MSAKHADMLPGPLDERALGWALAWTGSFSIAEGQYEPPV